MSEREVNLSRNQLQAVNHGNSPLCVIAGPGSGKTRVITSRIAHLLDSTDVSIALQELELPLE